MEKGIFNWKKAFSKIESLFQMEKADFKMKTTFAI
jgi:hypothetical protein